MTNKQDISQHDKALLNRQPSFDFIESRVQPAPEPSPINEQEIIPSRKEQLDAIERDYEVLDKLAEIVELLSAERGKDVSVKVDRSSSPEVIESIKRSFGDNAANKGEISLDMAAKAMDTLLKVANDKLTKFSSDDAMGFIINPGSINIKETFPTLGNNAIDMDQVSKELFEPLDTEKFKNDGVVQLFELMKPLIIDLILALVPGI